MIDAALVPGHPGRVCCCGGGVSGGVRGAEGGKKKRSIVGMQTTANCEVRMSGSVGAPVAICVGGRAYTGTDN